MTQSFVKATVDGVPHKQTGELKLKKSFNKLSKQ